MCIFARSEEPLAQKHVKAPPTVPLNWALFHVADDLVGGFEEEVLLHGERDEAVCQFGEVEVSLSFFFLFFFWIDKRGF